MKWKPLLLGAIAGILVGTFMGRKATGGVTPGVNAMVRNTMPPNFRV